MHTVYACWLEALDHGDGDTPVAITVREEAGTLAFEISRDGGQVEPRFDTLRDRVEALGGRLSIHSGPGRGIRVLGSLPLSR